MGELIVGTLEFAVLVFATYIVWSLTEAFAFRVTGRESPGWTRLTFTAVMFGISGAIYYTHYSVMHAATPQTNEWSYWVGPYCAIVAFGSAVFMAFEFTGYFFSYIIGAIRGAPRI